MQETHIQPY